MKSPIVQSDDYYPFGLAFNSYKRENGVDQRYLYNGMEIQRELDLGWLDYGARMYMPELGRWGVMDPLSKYYLGVSPYAYSLNSPVVNFDEGGKFVLPAHILNNPKYAKLVSYVKNDIHKVLDNKKVVDALKKYGGFTDEQLREHLTFGKGPEIDVKQLGEYYGGKVNGTYVTGTSTLNIDIDIVEKLQDADGLDSDAWLIILSSTILHEYVHYGNFQRRPEDRYDGEEGIAFEMAAYGFNFGQDVFEESKKRIKQWIEDQELRRNRAEQQRKVLNMDILSKNFSLYEEGTYTWNGRTWEKVD